MDSYDAPPPSSARKLRHRRARLRVVWWPICATLRPSTCDVRGAAMMVVICSSTVFVRHVDCSTAVTCSSCSLEREMLYWTSEEICFVPGEYPACVLEEWKWSSLRRRQKCSTQLQRAGRESSASPSKTTLKPASYSAPMRSFISAVIWSDVLLIGEHDDDVPAITGHPRRSSRDWQARSGWHAADPRTGRVARRGCGSSTLSHTPLSMAAETMWVGLLDGG